MNKIKYYILLLFIVALPALQTGCTKVLDKPDLDAISEGKVWSDINLATAFLNRLYTDAMPSWARNSSSPEAINASNASSESDESGGADDMMYGQMTINSVDIWHYETLRSINLLLKRVPAAPFTQADKNNLIGQALFLRAWLYWQMVSLYGGVPLILEPQELNGDLNVPRSKTSECIARITKDLDDAAPLLPNIWSDEEVGRITKGAAMALKGRVLLHYASEQFSPAQNADRWLQALQANKAALDTLVKSGKALMPDFGGLWFVEGNANTEAVMITRFNNPGRTHSRDAAVRPLDEASNYTGGDQPTLDLVNAFPMKNGLPITAPGSGYNAQAYWLNRDPRFAATIAWNGVLWQLSGKSGRIQWNFAGSISSGSTATGFYCRKAVNETYKRAETEISGTDWIEIRLAEVMMNYAEAANETGNTAAAYEVLKAIRKRAGIDAGGNELYGLTSGLDKSGMRTAILLERRLEFAFEGKRGKDLRRRRLYGQLNGTKRKGLRITLTGFGGDKNAFYTAYAAGSVNLNTQYNQYFNEQVIDVDLLNVINFRDNYYFAAIPRTHLEKNPKLQQTNGWDGGTFDPLQ
ncbi:RagB/SusD family nutrient uptake outer membrane protein [Chitinophaga sp. 22321]|uniref:RagB/SusD family nutrient uptake outer membrane protein n=1 Tax=Chitinophaga hostae TaxID=2831022 RepID=A0ABS5IYZ1_9BACT|nr:RagB/SusD family nutrient uptake outer membrane protein [Chitinophaga hostae]MBS0028189.1 RagB/SusD family nutrient uptake outer membrane protein [Chitinophaga hostae]